MSMSLQNGCIPQRLMEIRTQVALELLSIVVEHRISDLNAEMQLLLPVGEVRCQQSSSCSYKQLVIIVR
jgi:hypothetical protein